MFAANPERLPMTAFDDTTGMQEALQPLLPGVEVEFVVGRDWASDPLALGTWCIYRPGRLAQVLPDLRTTEGGCSSRAPTPRKRGSPSSTGPPKAATAPPATSTTT